MDINSIIRKKRNKKELKEEEIKLFIGKYIEKTKIFKHIYSLIIIVISFLIFNSATSGDIINSLKNMFGINHIELHNPETLYYLKSYLVLLIVAIISSTPLIKNIISKE